MITKYITKALERAVYDKIDGGDYCVTVRGLRGVIATGNCVESCRRNLVEVVEEWLLVRVSQHLRIPKLDGVVIRVRRVG